MAGSSAPLTVSASLLGDEQLDPEDDLDVLSYAVSGTSKPLETADSSMLATLSVQGAPSPPSTEQK